MYIARVEELPTQTGIRYYATVFNDRDAIYEAVSLDRETLREHIKVRYPNSRIINTHVQGVTA